jgi:hypothetical protein
MRMGRVSDRGVGGRCLSISHRNSHNSHSSHNNTHLSSNFTTSKTKDMDTILRGTPNRNGRAIQRQDTITMRLARAGGMLVIPLHRRRVLDRHRLTKPVESLIPQCLAVQVQRIYTYHSSHACHVMQ